MGTVNDTNLNGAFEIQKIGNYLYVTSTNAKTFCAIDVINVSSPTLESCYLDATYFAGIYDFEIIGTKAFVSIYSSGTAPTLAEIDISNPTNLNLIQYHKTNAAKYSLAKKGNTIFYSYATGSKYGQFYVNPVTGVKLQFQDGEYYGANTYQRLYVYGGKYITVSKERIRSMDVRPEINLGACSTAGQMSWDNINKTMGVCNGEVVKGMGPIPCAGGSGCVTPTGLA